MPTGRSDSSCPVSRGKEHIDEGVFNRPQYECLSIFTLLPHFPTPFVRNPDSSLFIRNHPCRADYRGFRPYGPGFRPLHPLFASRHTLRDTWSVTAIAKPCGGTRSGSYSSGHPHGGSQYIKSGNEGPNGGKPPPDRDLRISGASAQRFMNYLLTQLPFCRSSGHKTSGRTPSTATGPRRRWASP